MTQEEIAALLTKKLGEHAEKIEKLQEKAIESAKDNIKGEIDTDIANQFTKLKEELKTLEDSIEKLNIKSNQFEKITPEGKVQRKGIKEMLVKSLVTDGGIETLRNGGKLEIKYQDIFPEWKPDAIDTIRVKESGKDSLEKKDQTTTNSYTGQVILPDHDNTIWAGPNNMNRMRNLIPGGTTFSDKVEIIRETNFTNATSSVVEGAVLPLSEFDFAAFQFDVIKLGTILILSNEMMQDTIGLMAYLSAIVPEKLANVEDSQISNGSGTGDNLDGLLTTATPFAAPASLAANVAAPNLNDVIIAAKTQLALANFMAQYAIVNPSDIAVLSTAKDTQNRPLYPELSGAGDMTIGGLRVFQTTAMPVGSFVLGNFTLGCYLATREPLSLEFSREEKFSSDQVVVRAKERLTLCWRRPDAVVRGTIAAAITALTRP